MYLANRTTRVIATLICLCTFVLDGISQTVILYKNSSKKYSFSYPSHMKQVMTSSNIIDFKAVDKTSGSSIFVNTQPFQFGSQNFYNVTSLDIEKSVTIQGTYKVTQFYRTKISNYDAIIAYCKMISNSTVVKQISIFINYPKYNFTMIIGTIDPNFKNYEDQFINCFKSIKFD